MRKKLTALCLALIGTACSATEINMKSREVDHSQMDKLLSAITIIEDIIYTEELVYVTTNEGPNLYAIAVDIQKYPELRSALISIQNKKKQELALVKLIVETQEKE